MLPSRHGSLTFPTGDVDLRGYSHFKKVSDPECVEGDSFVAAVWSSKVRGEELVSSPSGHDPASFVTGVDLIREVRSGRRIVVVVRSDLNNKCLAVMNALNGSYLEEHISFNTNSFRHSIWAR